MFTERMGAIELLSRPEGRVALAGTLLAFLQVWPSLWKMLDTGMTHTMDKTKNILARYIFPFHKIVYWSYLGLHFWGTKRIGRNLDGWRDFVLILRFSVLKNQNCIRWRSRWNILTKLYFPPVLWPRAVSVHAGVKLPRAGTSIDIFWTPSLNRNIEGIMKKKNFLSGNTLWFQQQYLYRGCSLSSLPIWATSQPGVLDWVCPFALLIFGCQRVL